MTDQPTPSRLTGLRDEIAAALIARIKQAVIPRQEPWQTGQIGSIFAATEFDLADAVMPVLYREWPWLRAEAEDAAPEPVTDEEGRTICVCTIDTPCGCGTSAHYRPEPAPAATEATTITDLERQLAALRQVARGYCPHCGRGDAAPTATDWEQQKHRADQAEATLDQARRLRDDLAGITGARWIADALDHILNPTTATEATRPPTGKRDNQTTRSTGGQS